MQRIKASNRLLQLSGSKRFLCLLAILPVLAATPVFGQISVISLAMVSYDQSPARTTAAARNDSAASPLAYTSAPRLQYLMTDLSLSRTNPSVLLSDFSFEKQDGANPRDWSRFVYKTSNAAGRTGSWVHVEAGYGQFCQYESSLGKNGAELEQPSCAYLRASFSF